MKDESEEEDDEDDEDDEVVRAPARTTRSGRGVVSSYAEGDDDEEPVAAGKGSRRLGTRASSRGKSNRDDLDGVSTDETCFVPDFHSDTVSLPLSLCSYYHLSLSRTTKMTRMAATPGLDPKRSHEEDRRSRS